ncbi:MAG: bifunctional demethylmenaquinone methyltransferase/2-methoxy-6-polyprenyl-1,4-benzoquinol methylase UbiE [Usitatibacter sp.]
MSDRTHFGYQQVPEEDKARRVGEVFRSVASSYDVMNDLMSLGLHRVWKRFAIEMSGVRPGSRVLDVASGSGDLARAFARRVGEAGQVWMTDINPAMLEVGRDRMIDQGVFVPLALCDAERLPFPDATFDVVSVAFGLRNMTHKDRALAEMARVTRPGGRVIVLEFSRPWKPLAPAYDAYSFSILPALGKWVAHDEGAYRYLAESIRMHPDQETLKAMMTAAGLERVEYFNLAGGVVALHRGWRL